MVFQTKPSKKISISFQIFLFFCVCLSEVIDATQYFSYDSKKHTQPLFSFLVSFIFDISMYDVFIAKVLVCQLSKIVQSFCAAMCASSSISLHTHTQYLRDECRFSLAFRHSRKFPKTFIFIFILFSVLFG